MKVKLRSLLLTEAWMHSTKFNTTTYDTMYHICKLLSILSLKVNETEDNNVTQTQNKKYNNEQREVPSISSDT